MAEVVFCRLCFKRISIKDDYLSNCYYSLDSIHEPVTLDQWWGEQTALTRGWKYLRGDDIPIPPRLVFLREDDRMGR